MKNKNKKTVYFQNKNPYNPYNLKKNYFGHPGYRE